MTPEGLEKREVRKYLDMIGAYHFWPVQTGYGAATLDCLASIDGYFVGIEVKKLDYAPSDFTARQRVILSEITAKHGTTFAGDANEIIEGIKRWRAQH